MALINAFQYTLTATTPSGNNYFISLIFEPITRGVFINLAKYNGGSISLRFASFLELIPEFDAKMNALNFTIETPPYVADKVVYYARARNSRSCNWLTLHIVKPGINEDFLMTREEFIVVRRSLSLFDRLACLLFFCAVPNGPISDTISMPRIYMFFLPNNVQIYFNFFFKNLNPKFPADYTSVCMLFVYDGVRYWNIDYACCNYMTSLRVEDFDLKTLNTFVTPCKHLLAIGDDLTTKPSFTETHFVVNISLFKAICAAIQFLNAFVIYFNH